MHEERFFHECVFIFLLKLSVTNHIQQLVVIYKQQVKIFCNTFLSHLISNHKTEKRIFKKAPEGKYGKKNVSSPD